MTVHGDGIANGTMNPDDLTGQVNKGPPESPLMHAQSVINTLPAMWVTRPTRTDGLLCQEPSPPGDPSAMHQSPGFGASTFATGMCGDFPTGTIFCRFELDRLDRRIHLIHSVLWWSIAPCIIGGKMVFIRMGIEK